MSQDDFQDNEQPSDPWTSSFEDECCRELELQRVEPRLQAAEELAAQQLWLGFQNTSTAIAQLYNSKNANGEGYLVLVPFNKAAESLTKLYKDGVNSARESMRVGFQSGRMCRSKDIAAWARKKRKNIRREELLAFLCGKNLPPHSHHHRSRQGRALDRQMQRFGHQCETMTDSSSEYPLRENNSLPLQGLSGSVSNINPNYSRHSPTTSCSFTPLNRPSSNNLDDVMIHDEFGRSSSSSSDHQHRKRTNSSSTMDVCMDSPSRKRGKFM